MRARLAKKRYRQLVHAYHAGKLGDILTLPMEIQWEHYFRPAPASRDVLGFCGTRPSDIYSPVYSLEEDGQGRLRVKKLHLDVHGVFPAYRLGSYKKLCNLALADLAAWRKERRHAGQDPARADSPQG